VILAGLALTVLSAIAFGLSSVAGRRGMLGGSARQGIFISGVAGVPLFLVAAAASGQMARAGELSSAALLWLVAAGLTQFLFGRYCFYRCVGIIGANRAAPISGASVLISVVVAVVALGERLTPAGAAGIGLILLGATLAVEQPRASGGGARAAPRRAAAAASARASSAPPRPAVPGRALAEGYAFGLLAAVGYGLGPVCIREGLAGNDLGILGALISYVAAAAVLIASLARRGGRDGLRAMDRGALGWFLLAGLAVFFAQMCYYLALGLAPVVLVVPLLQSYAIFTLLLSRLVNPRVESFGRRVAAGILLVVLGSASLAL